MKIKEVKIKRICECYFDNIFSWKLIREDYRIIKWYKLFYMMFVYLIIVLINLYFGYGKLVGLKFKFNVII